MDKSGKEKFELDLLKNYSLGGLTRGIESGEKTIRVLKSIRYLINELIMAFEEVELRE